ncbi:hypothetical protein [Pseudobacteriovorax antillogorgiicola]|uniref:Outer membrane protein beta-barrel domain-containing protein n=1 Tax=Pseudobacteriovorax antillogorgiicola TaxID=1513793 RepID=A0A1Y6B4N4_9BACT|nr:hypothetical protein [Pseudobacteriovorax antillogorgiicola]TCS59550.1 hypothetical protein EDD56_101470 [Pseudobacteriovorax antillogorgiicola]SME87747.1 hypothetical protein SAMN06296036_10115 [Pseudobacteriovorax antillogorgiicola]
MKPIKTIILVLSLGAFGSSQGMAQDEELGQNEIENSSPTRRHRTYHFGIGVARPMSIGNDYNHYEKLFGSGSAYPEIWGEYSFLTLGGGFDLGVSFRTGLYQDSGKSAGNIDVPDGGLEQDLSDSDVDATQKSQLTLIPLQTSLSLSYAPFSSRFLVASVWGGLSYTYVENTTQANLDSSVDQSEVVPFVNSGFNVEQVVGASLSFDVSKIDPRAAYSLKVYGISGIFLTPFFQTVTTVSNEVGVYDRTTLGVMFSFEATGT